MPSASWSSGSVLSPIIARQYSASCVAFYEVAVVFVNAMPINLYNNSCVNDGMSWIYYDNIEYISNAVKMGWADAQPAFKKPTHTGHGNAHLRITHDIPLPESVDHGVFTKLAAIT
ncbi:alpha-glucanase [Colletotrichum higginsianum]|nr:alpha-glucanase [Colletotrichum higginsianum]